MAPQTILLVDDDPDVLDACRQILIADGYHVQACDSAAAGRAAARAAPPDLAILDIMMEECDSGLCLAAELGSKIPVILLSSIVAALGDNVDIHTFPIAAVVEKPVAPAVLRAAVQTALGRADALRRLDPSFARFAVARTSP